MKSRGIAGGRHRLTAAVLVVALCAMLIPPYAAPQPAQAVTVAQLKAQLAALRDTAKPAGDAYYAAVKAVEHTQDRMKATDARIKASTKKLTATQDALGRRADALYRDGGDLGAFEFILGSQSFDDFVTRMDLISLIASSDDALITSTKATRASLQTDRTALAADLKNERAALVTASHRYNALQAQMRSKTAEYNRLLGLIAAQTGGKPPAGANGMVFPVHGPHYYSDTWHAPRSGGRLHMGTDIMSPRGTPVVAVSSGTARPHYNGLGGKSITLTGSNGWTYYYAHLNGYAIKGTVKVKAGQLIGYVGNTGNAAGGACHLHFQMGPHGNWTDPYRWLRGMEQ
jgi:murein DD-endopeptidase MepM/ murein hydrolase activator NlpD